MTKKKKVYFSKREREVGSYRSIPVSLNSWQSHHSHWRESTCKELRRNHTESNNRRKGWRRTDLLWPGWTGNSPQPHTTTPVTKDGTGILRSEICDRRTPEVRFRERVTVSRVDISGDPVRPWRVGVPLNTCDRFRRRDGFVWYGGKEVMFLQSF